VGAAAPPEVAAVAAELGVPVDAVALAAVLQRPWVDVVLSGAVTIGQLDDNWRALPVHLKMAEMQRLDGVAEPVDAYWRTRSALPWQ
jgi:aryl-alcohol dehydrogenase-like predicted oxidoreductase